MRVTSDFECGNGKNIEQIVPGHFRLEEVGEAPPYCKYFCVRLQAEGDGGRVRLDIYPDPLLGESGRTGMMGHYPSQLWFSEDGMATWKPVEHVLEHVQQFHESHFTVEVRIAANATIYVASNPVISYTQVLAWAQSLANGAGNRCRYLSLGKSYEGREIPVLHLPATSVSAKRVFVLAGQHPSEHCGVLAAIGAAEFLTSHHREAMTLRGHYEFWICPMINVDGNVHGRNGWNMQNVNLFTDFAGAADNMEPQAIENRLLWRWLAEDVRPQASLHFHGYMGKRGFLDPPYDGIYAFTDPMAVYQDEGRAVAYTIVRDTLIWDTDGLTGHVHPSPLEENSLDYQLARLLGTIPAFYEINHGYHGVWAAKRKGAQVLRAMLGGRA
ncbi:MAG: M14 family zinc carboxypeptidase [Anaerolineae bacterium]